jgi:hypothetical protein
MADNFKSVLWTTSGDGFFQNPRQLRAGYLRGQQDISNGSVDLTLTVYGYLEGSLASDEMTLYIDSILHVNAGGDSTICFNYNYQCQGLAGNYTSLEWTSSGDGSFSDPNSLDPMYFPGDQDTLNGFVELSLTAFSDVCNDSIADTIMLGFTDCPGILEHGFDQLDMSVFPNPSEGIVQVNVRNLDVNEIEIQILDNQGKILFNQYVKVEADSFTRMFDLHYLEKGTYFVRMIAGKRQSTLPILLQ